MLIEERTFRLLNVPELIMLMDDFRGDVFDSKSPSRKGIFQNDIPENYRKVELAPFIRINPVDEVPGIYFDDEQFSEKQSVQVNWWCKNITESSAMKDVIDSLLKKGDFKQYYSNRYQDPEIKLRMNIRKYNYHDFN